MCRFNTCSSCEEQRCQAQYKITTTVFQYMLLLRGATPSRLDCKYARLFQYMLLLRGATEEKRPYYSTIKVSIHAPLARSNTTAPSRNTRTKRFQYMLLLRGATKERSSLKTRTVFQYMLLLRGATRGISAGKSGKSFNTCSSCEEQLAFKKSLKTFKTVSIHAPLARSN